MSAFLLGNLVGRLLFSVFAVWLVLLLMNKFNAKTALRRLRRPLPLIAVTVVFFLGLVGSAKAANPDDKQLFHVMTFAEASLDDVYLPAEPRWDYQLDKRHSTHAVILSSPANVANPAVLELVLDNRLRVDPAQMREISASTIAVVKEKLGLPSDVKASSLDSVAYDDLQGWKLGFNYRHQGTALAFEVEVLRFPSGHVVTAMSSARAGELALFASTKGKILRHLKEIS